jgi:hypothetical protein
MNKRSKNNLPDAVNLILSLGIAMFSTLLGSSLLIGLAAEPEKSQAFLHFLGWGVLLGGIGCGIYSFFIWTRRAFLWAYYLALAFTILGYGLAVIGGAMYKNL